MTTRVQAVVEYDGTDFHGWQAQAPGRGAGDASSPPVRTVQGELERALAGLCGERIEVCGASRTDVGVHAAGQTAHWDLPAGAPVPPERLAPALNARLAEDLRVVHTQLAPPGWHARHSARGKHYRYKILTRAVGPALDRRQHWHLRDRLDLGAMREAAELLQGTYDVSAFATELEVIQEQRRGRGLPPLETVRTLQAVRIEEEGGLERGAQTENRSEQRIWIEVLGSGFLYKMVRTIVGTLVQVGLGRRAPGWIPELIAQRDRRLAGPTAPALGLCLMRVIYEQGASAGGGEGAAGSEAQGGPIGPDLVLE